MREADRERNIRRILVALDASPHSLAALQAAADLANRLNAEILGLYIEDIRLLKLAELPGVRQVMVFSAMPRPFDRREAEQQLRVQAREARRALQRLAERTRIRWSFRVIQGLVANELLAAAEETDMILLGRAGWSRRRRLGSTARVIIARAPRPALILKQGERLSVPVGVVYDGSEQSKRALGVAATLLKENESYLTVIILADEIDEARGYQEEVSKWLRQNGLNARFRWLVRSDARKLKDMAQDENCGVLVLPGGGLVFKGEALEALLEQLECPVMLVR